MSYAAICKRRPASELYCVLDMLGPHDADVVDRDIHEEFVQLHILLRECVQKIVKLQAGYREYRLAVELGVI